MVNTIKQVILRIASCVNCKLAGHPVRHLSPQGRLAGVFHFESVPLADGVVVRRNLRWQGPILSTRHLGNHHFRAGLAVRPGRHQHRAGHAPAATSPRSPGVRFAEIMVLLRSTEIFDECFDFCAVPEHLDEEYLERCRQTPKTLVVLFISIIAFYIPYWIFSNGSNTPVLIWLPLDFKEAHPIFFKFLFAILAVVLISAAAILLGFISFHVTLSTVCTTMLMHLDDVLSALAQPHRFVINLADEEADAQDSAFYNEKVRETLIYAHNLHFKIIK